jgi:hypothetical protein
MLRSWRKLERSIAIGMELKILCTKLLKTMMVRKPRSSF